MAEDSLRMAFPETSLAEGNQLAGSLQECLRDITPDLTVERHLRNFHWKNPADLAHYREGLLKAGVPFGRPLTLVKSAG